MGKNSEDHFADAPNGFGGMFDEEEYYSSLADKGVDVDADGPGCGELFGCIFKGLICLVFAGFALAAMVQCALMI